MRLKALFLSLVLLFTGLRGQEQNTIRFKKESDIRKAVFDNTEYRLIAVDRFGNPLDEPIVSFSLMVLGNVSSEEFSGRGNTLSKEMLAHLRKQKKAVKMVFSGLNIRDAAGHLVRLPDFSDIWYPDCKNCGAGKKS
jgi:hypothetical protein